MIHIAPVRGTSQRLSPEHRVLYYKPDGTHDVCSAEEFMNDLHAIGANHLHRKFCSTFSVRSDTLLPLNDADIRLMVAVIADGHFQSNTNRCVVRLKKTHKVERLRRLVALAGLIADERNCGGKVPGYVVFSFDAPRREKEFTSFWWSASQAQLEIIADELPHWDSSVSSRPSGGIRFSTFVEASAHFAQYAFSATKHPTSLDYTYRDRTAEGRGSMVEYVVHAQKNDKSVGPGRKESVYVAPNKEGFKYCFEVPSSYLLLRHNGYIFATGNTGKTYVRIMAFAKRRKAKGGCMLVVAPRSLLRSVWLNDIKKFAPHIKVSVCDAANRDKGFAADADVYVTNTDAAKWLAAQKTPFFKKFTELVIDESTAFKHSTSQRSKAMGKIAKHFEYRACMTGTPNSLSITDVWHQAFILDGGKRLGNSFYKFRDSVCTPKQVGRQAQMVRWEDKDGAEEAVFGLLSDIVVRHRFEDCVDIPANHQYTVDYDLTPKQMKAYLDMEQTQLLTLSKSNHVTAINAAAVATKLMQISSGAVYDGTGKYQVVDTARYEMILDLIEQRKHSLTFFMWQHQRDMLVAEAEKRGISFCLLDGSTSDRDRDEMVKGYQAGVYRTMFAHPQSAAHGLTLTRGTATIWSCPTHNLEHFKQGSKRIPRMGQTQKTETIVVTAKGTIEELVYQKMLVKDARMTNLLELFASNTPLRKAA